MVTVKERHQVTPWWGSMGEQPRTAENAKEDELPLEMMMDLSRVVAGPFALSREQYKGRNKKNTKRGNFRVESVWKEFKGRRSLQTKFRNAIVVDQEYKATRATAAAAESEDRRNKLKELTCIRIDKLYVEDLKNKAQERGVAIMSEDGKNKFIGKKELVKKLKEWVKDNGKGGEWLG
jgi:hypothetical protein